jgi:hypothetical protein
MADSHQPGARKGSGHGSKHSGFSSREVLIGGAGAAALGALPQQTAAETAGAASSATPGVAYPASRSAPVDRPYNIVLFISDEEAYHIRPAAGYSTPAREELMQRGTSLPQSLYQARQCARLRAG